ncbi:hypothetical protein BJ875DRAFT_210681 [Amylocarpus encephaloides]|uniref:Lysine-specific metallo-endopeptidase domain-containing protein n=1 Tax=Amylocarpus encephaloides TaxID=45428 RepID=A0A9P8C7U9_9HELO|nr:hypothetical protein BJ875DRAFT_210681 [Amylocarpus encephaloides]
MPATTQVTTIALPALLDFSYYTFIHLQFIYLSRMRSQTFWGLVAAILSITFRNVAAAPGYFIDEESCTEAQRTAVQNVLDGTFEMATAGLQNGANAKEDNPQQKLIDNLFGVEPATTDPKFGVKAAINAKFTSILRLKDNRLKTNDELQPNTISDNVKIYCDERRLQIRKRNPLQSFDRDVGEVKATGDCLTAVAWAGQTDRSFAQLQICPKLMKRILVDDFKTTAKLPPSLWAKLVSNFITTVGKISYAPIDRVQLSDKVLLHELTHLNIGGLTDDVGGFFKAYGWKNCRKLSMVTENKLTLGGLGNADSWALYGSVSLLIRDVGKTVDAETGNIINIAPPTTKRALDAIKSAAGYWRRFVA